MTTQSQNGHTSGPWTVSDAQSVEGEYLVVGGEGQDFGLIASCTEKADAELIASAPSLKARIAELEGALRECAIRLRYDGDLFHDQGNAARRDASWRVAALANALLPVEESDTTDTRTPGAVEQALAIAVEMATEAFEYAETKDDHMLCEARFRAVESALAIERSRAVLQSKGAA